MAQRTTTVCVALLALAATRADAQGLRYDSEYPEMRYSSRTPSTRVERLRQSLARGETTLTYESERGYLSSLLGALGVSRESQILVYSRTSLQQGLISPESPRAIYFGDDVYVAWVRGSDVLEIAAMDRTLGPVFYTLDQRATDPAFERLDADCLECHDTYGLTGGGVPRFLVGSGFTDANGRPAVHGGWRLTSDQTPLERRWGGWYVTGTHGSMTHMGNVVIDLPGEAVAPDLTGSGNLTDLAALIDTAPYLTAHSDIVALLVVEHQIHVQNELTRLGWEIRRLPDAARADEPRVAELTEPLVRALLFADEAALGAPIVGTSGFREAFESRGIRDPDGRSLRDMELRTRIFRYPVSYLIHSDAFAALPAAARQRVYQRIREVLSARDPGGGLEGVALPARQAALEILTRTDDGFRRWLRERG